MLTKNRISKISLIKNISLTFLTLFVFALIFNVCTKNINADDEYYYDFDSNFHMEEVTNDTTGNIGWDGSSITSDIKIYIDSDGDALIKGHGMLNHVISQPYFAPKVKHIKFECDIPSEKMKIYFNSTNIEKTKYIFEAVDTSLITVDFNNALDTSEAECMADLFKNCVKLKFVDLSSLDMSNVNDMSYMFYRCYDLEKVIFPTTNVARPEDLAGLFYACIELKEIDNLDKINFSDVTDVGAMFRRCFELKEVTLPHSADNNTGKVESFSEMFSYCLSLEKVNVDEWNFESALYVYDMFINCASLKDDSSDDGIIKLNRSGINDTIDSEMYCSNMFGFCQSVKKLTFQILMEI